MKKICFLHTDEDIISQVRSMLPRIPVKADIDCLCAPSLADIPEYASRAAAEGASALVSWAAEAFVLRNTADCAAVEITLGAADLMRLIQEAKALVQKERPVVALIACAGQCGKPEAWQEFPDAVIMEYQPADAGNPGHHDEQMRRYVDEALKKGADCVVGSRPVCSHASRLGAPNLPLRPSFDSLAGAFQAAEKLCSALDAEKQKAAQLRAAVNNCGGGIIWLNKTGKIVFLNYAAQELLGSSSAALEGRALSEALPIPREDCDTDALLSSGKGCSSVLVRRGGLTLAADFVPVMDGSSLGGVVVSLRELQKIEKEHSELYRKLYADTFSASGTFGQLVAQSPVMATAVKQARVYACYDTPILITGEIGSGKKAIAQCIHNASTRRGGPFAAVDCSIMPPEALDSLLYGTNKNGREHAGLLRIANDGTLYLGNVCSLDMYAQQKLAGVLSDNTYFDPATGQLVTLTSRVRLICASRQDIGALVAAGKFSPALYCALQTLTLHVPALRERRIDIEELTRRYVAEFSSRHKKYLRLEDNVFEAICRFSWPGNAYQLSKYCERLVVLAEGDSIDAGIAEQLLPIWGESYAEGSPENAVNEHERILCALRLHGGNRNDVAEELGLSKTTLWRRMKQYGIQWQ
ncbi:MAG: sigma 54-interacting transcriptional regulator [Spirochaetia bacterium]|jgi:transcriptional regulator with PAS, ATPase and Fis domain|nr:sigma 54-interacting transcriptional regulator [Spirochaetia bacterium]